MLLGLEVVRNCQPYVGRKKISRQFIDALYVNSVGTVIFTNKSGQFDFSHLLDRQMHLKRTEDITTSLHENLQLSCFPYTRIFACIIGFNKCLLWWQSFTYFWSKFFPTWFYLYYSRSYWHRHVFFCMWLQLAIANPRKSESKDEHHL